MVTREEFHAGIRREIARRKKMIQREYTYYRAEAYRRNIRGYGSALHKHRKGAKG